VPSTEAAIEKSAGSDRPGGLRHIAAAIPSLATGVRREGVVTTIANIVLAEIAGLGGGGLVAPMALGLMPPAARRGNPPSGRGTTQSDAGLSPRQRLPGYPTSSSIIGGIAVMMLWFVYGPAVDPANVTLAAAGLAAVGGAVGGTGSIPGQA
jgi:hypothetical protein